MWIQFHLIRQDKREFTYSDLDKLIADRMYYKIPDEDWNILYENLNTGAFFMAKKSQFYPDRSGSI